MNPNALDLPIVVLCESGEPTSELRILADAVLTSGMTDRELFKAIKTVLHMSADYREQHLRSRVAQLEVLFERAASSAELAALAADELSSCLDGWSAVHLIDGQGRIASAECGANRRIFTHVPEVLLQDRPVFTNAPANTFVRTLTMHEEVADAFLSLTPLSMGSIPLIYGGEHVGTVVAATLRHSADPAEWRFVTAACELLAKKFVQQDERTVTARPELVRIGRWNALEDSPFTIAFCNGLTDDLCWRFVRIADESMLIRLCRPGADENAVESEFALRAHTTHSLEPALRAALGSAGLGIAALYRHDSRTLTYVRRGMSEPLIVGRGGPSAVVQSRGAGENIISTARLLDAKLDRIWR